jgi:ribosome biogenesis protein ENP2
MIGTELLKPKMHGFYMDARLFDRIKPQDDVQQYETVVENKVQQQLAKLRDDRITVKRRLPKVNKQYAEQLMMANLSSQRNKKAKNQEGDDVSDSKMPLIDDRFAAMFANKDFEVDATSREFRRLNPSLIAQQRMKAKQAEAEASEDEQNAMFEAVSDSEDIDSDDDMVYSKKARQKVEKMQAQLKAEEGHHTVRTSRQPAMFAMKDGLNVGHVLGQTASKKKKQSTKKLSLQDRLAQKAAKKAAK